MSEIVTRNDDNNDDPCDGIDVMDLTGWTRYDSSGMRKKNNGEGLGRDSGDRYQDSWIRFDND